MSSLEEARLAYERAKRERDLEESHCRTRRANGDHDSWTPTILYVREANAARRYLFILGTALKAIAQIEAEVFVPKHRAGEVKKPECNWDICRSAQTGKCFAWCKCRCHNMTRYSLPKHRKPGAPLQ